jgi:hypothetical protein
MLGRKHWPTGGTSEELAAREGWYQMNQIRRAIPKTAYERLAVLLALCLAGVFAWGASQPVLVHTHIFTRVHDQSCGESNEGGTGITILNPVRSRDPERIADAFLRAASGGECSAGLREDFCSFVKRHPVTARDWRLVNRWDSRSDIRLFYRPTWVSREPGRNSDCAVIQVHLERVGPSWRVSGYGVS